MKSAPANFDGVARPYRRLEYLTLGRALERCRFHFLPQLSDRTHALVLGDGDGRFVARLLVANPSLTAHAVDTSAAMLTLLRSRCAFATTRITTLQADALAFTQTPPGRPYDLVVTHFFLDCLTQAEADTLAAAMAPRLTPNALWLVSDFCIPPGATYLPAAILVRSLYFVFRILTGLRVTRLPDHAFALTQAGLTRIAQHHSRFGILTTELWALSRESICHPPDSEVPPSSSPQLSA